MEGTEVMAVKHGSPYWVTLSSEGWGHMVQIKKDTGYAFNIAMVYKYMHCLHA